MSFCCVAKDVRLLLHRNKFNFTTGAEGKQIKEALKLFKELKINYCAWGN